MGWSVCLVGSGGDKNGDVVELVELGEILSPASIDEIGVDQKTAKDVLARLQAAFVALQEGAMKRAAKERFAEGSDVALKDYRVRKVQTLFGTVSGPVAFLCRPKCSFEPPFARKRPGFSSPVLSASGARSF